MQDPRLNRLLPLPPAELCRQARLIPDPEIERLLEGAEGHAEVLTRLIQAHQLRSAALYLAYALPTREGVWWASQCVRSTAGDTPVPAVTAALAAAEAWARQPADDLARQAFAASESAPGDSGAAMAALAAFYGAQSIGPADADPVPPPPGTAARLVHAAVALAAVAPDPEKVQERYQRFLAQGILVAGGGKT